MDQENDKNKDEELISSNELIELEENRTEQSRAMDLMGILLGILFFILIHNISSIYDMYTDESIPLVQCPRNFQNDRPVLMNTMATASDVAVDNWIRSFVVTYIRARYPRSFEDVEPMYNYVKTRSKGEEREKFESRIDSIKELANQVGFGTYIKFYFKDTQKIRIRKIESKIGAWIVSVDGYMHKRGSRMEKTQPTINLTVEKGIPILSNPEGLYVTNYEVKYLTDPISGDEMEL